MCDEAHLGVVLFMSGKVMHIYVESYCGGGLVLCAIVGPWFSTCCSGLWAVPLYLEKQQQYNAQYMVCSPDVVHTH